MNQNVSKKFKEGSLVWAKRRGFDIYWPGTIWPEFSKPPPRTNRKYHCVAYYGSSDKTWVSDRYILDYYENVDIYSNFEFENINFKYAVDHIHDRFWKEVELKREPLSGYQVDKEEASMIENEKKMAYEEMGISPIGKVSNVRNPDTSTYDSSPGTLVSFFLSSTTRSNVQNNHSRCVTCKSSFGFLGVGVVSSKLIYSLLSSGHIVNIWSRDGIELREVSRYGAERKLNPATVIYESNIVFYCSGDHYVSRYITFAKDSYFDGCKKAKGQKKIFVELMHINDIYPVEDFKMIVEYQGGYFVQVKCLIPQVNEEKSPIFICAGNIEICKIIKVCLSHVTNRIAYTGPDFGVRLPLHITTWVAEELIYLHSPTFFLPSVEHMKIDNEAFLRVTNSNNNIYERCHHRYKEYLKRDIVIRSNRVKYILDA